ncbi:dihydroneopterin aldolase [Cellulophaga sp. F20128]|uniref:dihydroneopterin aldolase n=1 Tax=Cellulophaga sp. F20128 TaxID=2926413 RepID=UPI001FF3BE00|nr:dihydroneopterin aldolase [Cellulophaga sp. F20128]MCK0158102.1 dihydroneopterin aldolase [Cellulophaga sp. F20128]
MGTIVVGNIKVYAYHGCLYEEAQIGSDYLVNVSVSADLKKAAISDALKDTVDYVHINHIVQEEMATRSKLLEHVAKRIIDRIFSEISIVNSAEVSVAKINPPIGGDVDRVSITLQLTR